MHEPTLETLRALLIARVAELHPGQQDWVAELAGAKDPEALEELTQNNT